MRMIIQTNNNSEIILNPISIESEDGTKKYRLINDDTTCWMELQLIGSSLQVLQKSSNIIDTDKILKAKLDDLVLELIAAEQSGTESNEISDNPEINPYNPDEIKVQSKQFNIKLISEMIDMGDIDLSPDFQRNFVWDNIQKTRLIESILLRIPLPMFYFSEDMEGRLTVVDGLQRLTTIKEFMDNKFPLKGLEYLKDSCEGRFYSDKKKDSSANGKLFIESTKYFRWFNMTQFSVNVIDPASPAKVKYDIFRRINTGGKPLNNQEIRNCLSSKNLRETLKEMVNLPEFKIATADSIKSTRMDDQEIALRFICFYLLYNEDSTLSNYNGTIELSLDDITEKLAKSDKYTLNVYVNLFSNAMKNAEHLLGKYAFRKILPRHLEVDAKKQLINKALFVSLSVILSTYDVELIKYYNEKEELVNIIAKSIEEDKEFFNYLSFGTNGKANLQYIFNKISLIVDSTVKF